MSMIRLAFAPRFIVYTLSILLTAALLLTVLAYPPAIDLAAVLLTVFARFTILGTRDLASIIRVSSCRRISPAACRQAKS
jgi:hypothetical protein